MAMRFGQGDHVYELAEGWGQLPDGWEYVDAVGVVVDDQDRVYVFTRGTHPVLVFDRDGKLLCTWGDGVFANPHGLQIGADGSIYCVDNGDHTVRKFTPDGKLLLTIGTPGEPSDTGFDGDLETLRGGPPFNAPTNVTVTGDSDIYVADGYKNCKVHHFDAGGRLIRSWGSAGRGPSQFRLVHGACCEPEGTILIGDRVNDRVQRFSPEGQYVCEWRDVRQPDDVHRGRDGFYYVAELGSQDGVIGQLGARVTVRDANGRIVSAWGDEGDPAAPGNFAAPHGICTDSRGDLYVGEVTYTARISRGLVPAGTHVLQKFVRVG